jgi:cytochrome c1
MTPDEIYSVLQMGIIVMVFLTMLLLFAHIAYEKTERS